MILKNKMDPRCSSAFKMIFEGKISRQLANGQNIEYFEEKKLPKG